MIKYLLGIVCAVSFLSFTGCSVDCEVCVDFDGEKQCEVKKDLKKKDCEGCSDIEGVAEVKAMGIDVTCSVK